MEKRKTEAALTSGKPEQTGLLKYMLENGITQFHVVKHGEEYLKEHGFSELKLEDKWQLQAGTDYYVRPYSSVMIAFHLPKQLQHIRIATSHTDFPMLKLKPSADMEKGGYHMLNIETYGGLLMKTWFDRPLGLAGKVVIKGSDAFHPEVRLYDSEKPVAIIPSLAPHLKRGDAETKLDPQKELIPVFGLWKKDESHSFLDEVAEKLQIDKADVLDYDLYLYNCDTCQMIGDSGLFTSPRIDNVSSVSAILESLVQTGSKWKEEKCKRAEAALPDEKISTADVSDMNLDIGVFFDNEEIGSLSKQGADSGLLRMITERILKDSGESRTIQELLPEIFLISLDVAHGTHPNYQEKSDPVNRVLLGNGVVLKSSASQRYVTDSEADAVIQVLCEDGGIPFQRTVNKTGMPGGTTLGPIVSSYLPVKAVDMGMPVLAMHSACEMAHLSDYESMKRLLIAFWLK